MTLLMGAAVSVASSSSASLLRVLAAYACMEAVQTLEERGILRDAVLSNAGEATGTILRNSPSLSRVRHASGIFDFVPPARLCDLAHAVIDAAFQCDNSSTFLDTTNDQLYGNVTSRHPNQSPPSVPTNFMTKLKKNHSQLYILYNLISRLFV